jgi:hypothetical protein
MAKDYSEPHVIIIGGTSVNEPHHDKSPFNFINSGCWKAKKYPKGTVRVLFYTPSYEKRALDQDKESPKVDRNELLIHTHVLGIDLLHIGCTPDKDFFLKVVKRSQAVTGFGLTTIASAADLTAELNKFDPIQTLEYFGHSNAEKFLLNYGIDGRGVATDTWGIDQARGVLASQFARGAKFISYGCNQGASPGLAEKLRGAWGIEAVGAEDKTDFDHVLPPHWLPASRGAWYRYPERATDSGPFPPREATTIPAE